MLRRIFRKLHSMNRRSFLYILAKLHAKIMSKQDSAKSFVYYNVAGTSDCMTCCERTHMSVYLKILSYIRLFLKIPNAVVFFIFLQGFNRKYKKIDKI